MTGEDETQLEDAPDFWRAWARDLAATRVPGGHFCPEEAPEELAAVLAAFLDDRSPGVSSGAGSTPTGST